MRIELLESYITKRGAHYKAGDIIELDFGTAKNLVSAGKAKQTGVTLEVKDEAQKQPRKSRKNDRRSSRTIDDSGSEELPES